eukprot:Platyproteum_vivax@DN10286_c0_g1_i1.p1
MKNGQLQSFLYVNLGHLMLNRLFEKDNTVTDCTQIGNMDDQNGALDSFSIQNLEHALTYYRTAWRRAPRDTAISNYYGYALVLAGRFDEAVHLWSEAHEICPDSLAIMHNLAVAFCSRGYSDMKRMRQAVATQSASVENPARANTQSDAFGIQPKTGLASQKYEVALTGIIHDMKSSLSLWQILLSVLEEDCSRLPANSPKDEVEHYSKPDLISTRLVRECKEWAESLLPSAQDLALRYLGQLMQSRLSSEKLLSTRRVVHSVLEEGHKRSLEPGQELNSTLAASSEVEPKKRRLRSRGDEMSLTQQELVGDIDESDQRSLDVSRLAATVEDELFEDSEN